MTTAQHQFNGRDDLTHARHALVRARGSYYELPTQALAVAVACEELGQSFGDAALRARSAALQGAVSLHRGDLRGGLALAVAAERHADATDDPSARAEVAAVKGQVSFFTGSNVEALSSAERAVAIADASGDLGLRIHTRRASCPVFGSLDVPDLHERILTMLELAVRSGDPWEQAISRNDLACYLQGNDIPAALAEIERALQCARAAGRDSRFAQGVVHSTRADIQLAAGRPREALADTRRAMALFSANGEPNPYVLAATVRAEVQARMALGQLDDACASGEGALRWLGDRVPQLRSLILSTLAQELRAAGHLEQAYDALARSAALERQAFQELSELQLNLDRAMLETAQLREQADRDWLTGLHNRRYLARALGTDSSERLPMPLALAVLDLDHFKAVNDRFGHGVGDQVLVRVARRLCDVLRERDVVARSGGEEFLVLMPATGLRAAAVGCERIRQAIEDEPWDAVADGLVVTASIGLAVAEAPAELDGVAALADARLYEAKRRGRNRVVDESSAVTVEP